MEGVTSDTDGSELRPWTYGMAVVQDWLRSDGSGDPCVGFGWGGLDAGMIVGTIRKTHPPQPTPADLGDPGKDPRNFRWALGTAATDPKPSARKFNPSGRLTTQHECGLRCERRETLPSGNPNKGRPPGKPRLRRQIPFTGPVRMEKPKPNNAKLEARANVASPPGTEHPGPPIRSPEKEERKQVRPILLLRSGNLRTMGRRKTDHDPMAPTLPGPRASADPVPDLRNVGTRTPDQLNYRHVALVEIGSGIGFQAA